jgi:hypothetical protein
MERNTSVGSVPMCSASQTDFSTFSDPLLESANLRKFLLWLIRRLADQDGNKTGRKSFQTGGEEL